jgi:L-seryl-tRNA(Ser) seleniumtransferase
MSFYTEHYGLTPVINAMGSMTSLGGSRMHPACVEAMSLASREFVDLNKLLVQAGQKAAELARAPPGYTAHIVTGAAASIVLSVCASMTGEDKERIAALPNTSGMNSKILCDAASDTRWNRNILLTGATPVLLGTNDVHMTAAELESALKDGGVAAVLYFAVGDDDGEKALPLKDVVRISHAYGANVIVDGAAQLPPVSNLWKYTTLGVDFAIFSGGKHMRGPQTSGLLLGREDVIKAARLNGSPNEETIARAMKCSKEDICGLVAALEQFVLTGDEEGGFGEEMARYEAMVADFCKALTPSGGNSTPGLQRTYRVCPGPVDIQPNIIPRAYIDLTATATGWETPGADGGGADAAAIYGDSVDHGNPLAVTPNTPPNILAFKLANGTPCIGVNTTKDGIMINPEHLSLDEVPIIIRRVKEAAAKMVAEGIVVAAAARL